MLDRYGMYLIAPTSIFHLSTDIQRSREIEFELEAVHHIVYDFVKVYCKIL